MPRPTEQGTIEENRDWLILIRNEALKNNDFSIAVGLSHTIAWLYWLMELEEKSK